MKFSTSIPNAHSALVTHTKRYETEYHSFNKALLISIYNKTRDIVRRIRKLGDSPQEIKHRKRLEHTLAFELSQVLKFVPSKHDKASTDVWQTCYNKLLDLAKQDGQYRCPAALNNMGLFYLTLTFSADHSKEVRYRKMARQFFIAALDNTNRTEPNLTAPYAAYNTAMMLDVESARKSECEQVLWWLLSSIESIDRNTREPFFKTVSNIVNLLFVILEKKKGKSRKISHLSDLKKRIIAVNEMSYGPDYRVQQHSQQQELDRFSTYQQTHEEHNTYINPECDIFGPDPATQMILDNLPDCFIDLDPREKKIVIQLLMSVIYNQNNEERSDNYSGMDMYAVLKNAMNKEKTIEINDLLNWHEMLTGKKSGFEDKEVRSSIGRFLSQGALEQLTNSKGFPENIIPDIASIERETSSHQKRPVFSLVRYPLIDKGIEDTLILLLEFVNNGLKDVSKEDKLYKILEVIRSFSLIHPFKEGCNLIARALFFVLCWKHDISFNMPIGYFDNNMLSFFDGEQISDWLITGNRPQGMPLYPDEKKNDRIEFYETLLIVIKTGHLSKIKVTIASLKSSPYLLELSKIKIPTILWHQCDRYKSTPVPVPKWFCCPYTCTLMKDPVVATNGLTYECSALVDLSLPRNILIRKLIEEWKEKNWPKDGLLSIFFTPPGEPYKPEEDGAEGSSAPQEYYCPITYQLMENPVIAADGQTYVCSAIEYWFVESKKNTSPLTGAELINKDLIPNTLVQELIHQWKIKNSLEPTTTSMRR